MLAFFFAAFSARRFCLEAEGGMMREIDGQVLRQKFR
jgi:hypothetical protein